MSESSPQNKRIRLALAITELEVGGAERALVNLACGLSCERFEPVVYSLAPRPAKERAALVEQLEAAGVETHFLDVTSRWQFFSAIGKLRKRLEQQAPHVLQTFLYHANIVGTLAGRRSGVNSIVAGIRVAEPNRRRLFIERMVLRPVDRIACVSKSVADYSHAQGGLPVEKLVVISNGIDLLNADPGESLDLQSLGIAASRKAILYVGRLEQQKGLDWLLQLAPGLLEKLPEHDLLLVGDGSQREKLTAQAKRLHISDRVHFAGWRPDAAAIMRSSELLILPSRWEGMPNVLLEAMAAGLPVVASRASGVEELLGPLAEPQTSRVGAEQDFIDRVVTLATDVDFADELGMKNRERVEEHFSLKKMVAEYEKLYEQCCGSIDLNR